MRRALARVQKVKERKVEAAAKKKRVEEEVARKVAEEERKREAAAQASTARRKAAQEARKRAKQIHKISISPRRPIVELRRVKGKGKERVQAEAAGGDPDDGSNGEDNEDDDRTPCEQCRVRKLSCQMQAGVSNLTGKQLAVLESQMAQLLADNRQLREGQVKANTYHCHFNKKLNWLMMDATRRRRSPPETPEAGPSELSKKHRRIVDSDEDGKGEMEEKAEREGEEVEVEGGEEEVEEEGNELAPKKARSEKGKEREE
ncbi:hypothetical protein LENED_008928 [Lentinula edodes]|uniref:Uncharacterized protein n=1 Tax=Lentinula edodes TaxID=5353 RepID=A0A1Q3EIH6_LENED|nr:hypothetical protein LENED_008928 [Lentinula edodes]